MSTHSNDSDVSRVEKALIELLGEATDWYEDHRKRDKSARTNTINVGLIVSRMVRDGLPIPQERLLSENQSQVRGLSGTAIKKILAEHGEHRKYTSEGGRTSRGTIPKAQGLVARWNRVNIDGVDVAALADQLESFFVEKAKVDYFDKQRIKVDLNHRKPVSLTIGEILEAAAAREDRPTGAVLQHLIGAKLELRFPDLDVGRDKANTADLQTDRYGDFQLGTTAFHVTVSPMEKLMDRCRENLSEEVRPVIIVPASRVLAAKQLAEVAAIDHSVGIVEAESYIGTNIEELALYSSDQIREGLARLIRRYNERIADVESDLSLRVDEPKWLSKIADEQGF